MPAANGRMKKTKPQTGNYKQHRTRYWQHYRDLPLFSFAMIHWMLQDSTVRLGLGMREAAICGAQFAYKDGQKWNPGIRASSNEVGEFVLQQLRQFWKHDIQKMAQAQVWGWSAAEVTYKQVDGLWHIDRTYHRLAEDVRPLKRDGELAGVRFMQTGPRGNVDLQFPYCYWHSYNSIAESHFGDPATRGCYSAWADKQLDGGATDVRRLFMVKDSYGGARIGYPEEEVFIQGDQRPNRDLAMEMVEQAKAGQVITFPTARDAAGNLLWVIEDAKTANNPQHILQYPKDLDVEILRGLEIPDDVLTSEATGAWQGKQVPMQAFFSAMDKWLAQLVRCFDEQILQNIVRTNFGPQAEYQIETKPLAEQAMEMAGAGEQDPQQQQPEQMARFSIDNGVINAAAYVQAARNILDRASEEKAKRLAHAPAGGITIAGKEFKGGQFIPKEVMEQATKEERAAVESDGDIKTKLSDDQQQAIGEWLAEKGHKAIGMGALRAAGMSKESSQSVITEDDRNLILFHAGYLGDDAVEDGIEAELQAMAKRSGKETNTVGAFLLATSLVLKKHGREAIRKDVVERAGGAKVVEFENKDGGKLILHPAVRDDKTSDWQLTTISVDGTPAGHVNPPTYEEGLFRAVGASDDAYWNEHGYAFKSVAMALSLDQRKRLASDCGASGTNPAPGFQFGNWCWQLGGKHKERLRQLTEKRQAKEQEELETAKEEALLDQFEQLGRDLEEEERQQVAGEVEAERQAVAKAEDRKFRRSKLYRDISETIGTDDPEIVNDFRGLMQDLHGMMVSEAEEYNDAFDELVDQIVGRDIKGRQKRGAFVSSLKRAADPTRIPKFDEVVQYVRDNPAVSAVLADNLGESVGSADVEAMVFEGLKRGKKAVPTFNSDATWQAALEYLETVEPFEEQPGEDAKPFALREVTA